MAESKIKNKGKIILIIAIILVAIVIAIALMPVSFDAGACGGGFRKYIADKYAYSLGELFVHNHPNYNNFASYSCVPDVMELTDNMEWHGRVVRTKATILFENKPYKVIFKGKRYWIETYMWEVESIIEG